GDARPVRILRSGVASPATFVVSAEQFVLLREGCSWGRITQGRAKPAGGHRAGPRRLGCCHAPLWFSETSPPYLFEARATRGWWLGEATAARVADFSRRSGVFWRRTGAFSGTA